MKTPLLLLALAAIAAFASVPLLFASDTVWVALLSVVTLLVATAVSMPHGPDHFADHDVETRGAASVGVGTVRAVDGLPTDRAVGRPQTITIDVENVAGHVFTGRLRHCDTALRPGAVLLVTFDPEAREELSLADDIEAVRADFDRMLVAKGLLTNGELDLMRNGVKTSAVVTGVGHTGVAREDHREVVLDLMVSRVGGGQFPAHESALVPVSALARIRPGSVVDVYYRHDQAGIAVCVPPD